MIGGMDEDSNTRRLLTSSIPYYQDDETWCVAVAKPEELWKGIFQLFDLIEWTGIIGIICLFAVILYIIAGIDDRNENMHWTLLASLSLTIGLATAYEPKKSNVRFMFFFFLFYGLIFSSFFHSFLVNVLSNPMRKPQVANAPMAIQQRYRFAGGTLAATHIDGGDETSATIAAAYELCADIDVCMQQLRAVDTLAVAVSRQHAMNAPTIAKADLFCFPKLNNVYSYSVSMLMRKNFHLLAKMNSIIRRVMEFGLIQKWERDGEVEQLLKLKKQEMATALAASGRKQDDDENVVVLTVGHIAGAMIIMAVGYALATFVFCMELLVMSRRCFFRRRRRRQRHRLWLLANAFLDAKRYFFRDKFN